MRALYFIGLSLCLSCASASAQTVPSVPGDHGIFDNGAQTPGSEGISGDGSSYTLPAATATTLGGVKIGSGVTVAADGTISVSGITGDYLPLAGGTMEGAIGFAPSGTDAETLLNIISSDGDSMTVAVQLGLFSRDYFTVSGSNHTPYYALSFLGNTVSIATMEGDPTGINSGEIAGLPTFTSADAGLNVGNGGPFVVADSATAPAATDACVAGTERRVGTYWYRCIASGNWGRIQFTTGY